MIHTHYVRTPISEPPKEAGTYICILSDGNIELLDYGGFKDSWDGGVLCDPENTQTVISWLKPCTVTGAVDEGKFAEWCNENEWNIIERTETGEAIWMRKANGKEYDYGDVKTTQQILEIFKAESK